MLVLSHRKSGFSRKSFKHKTTNKSKTVDNDIGNKILKVKTKPVKRGPRPNKKPITKNIIFAGANIAGAKSKWKSWKKNNQGHQGFSIFCARN